MCAYLLAGGRAGVDRRPHVAEVSLDAGCGPCLVFAREAECEPDQIGRDLLLCGAEVSLGERNRYVIEDESVV